MAELLAARFSKASRLHTASEFQTVFENGVRTAGVFFRLHFLVNSEAAEARLGLAIPKKAVPLSVGRNRIKRVCREQFRQGGLAIGDYVLVAQRKAAVADNAALRQEIARLFSGRGNTTAS
jgi:ribonuclease P protein component